jgi:hypothetical protein
MWAGTAWTRWLWAALTAVGGACLTGVAGAGYGQGRTAARTTWNGVTDKWGRATSGPGGSGRGAGESASEWGSTARGANRWAR